MSAFTDPTILHKTVGTTSFEVHLRRPTLDRYGKLVFEWKIPGIRENTVADRDGWLNCATFDQAKGAVMVSGVKVGTQAVNGFALTVDQKAAADAELLRLSAEREARIVALVASGPVGFTFLAGCDTADTYGLNWADGADFDETFTAGQRLGTDDAIKTWVKYAELKAIAAETGAKVLPDTGSSYGGFRFDRAGYDRLAALATERQAERDTKEREHEAAATAKRSAVFAEAKRTGKRQPLSQWTTDRCMNRNHNECSFDNATEYALPNGTTKTEYICCY